MTSPMVSELDSTTFQDTTRRATFSEEQYAVGNGPQQGHWWIFAGWVCQTAGCWSLPQYPSARGSYQQIWCDSQEITTWEIETNYWFIPSKMGKCKWWYWSSSGLADIYSVDEAVNAIMELGPGTQLAKLDIQSAYCSIPVHSVDRWLLGMEWSGMVYINTVLPFGWESAPKVFKCGVV